MRKPTLMKESLQSESLAQKLSKASSILRLMTRIEILRFRALRDNLIAKQKLLDIVYMLPFFEY
jgi:hypothetical protein